MALNWTEIHSVDELHEIWDNSLEKPAVFFKHSTRCSISSMALRAFERNWLQDDDTQLFFIDLIANRDVSNLLAELSKVEHQSPQIIVTKNQIVLYSDSHGTIDAEKVQKLIQ
jgi:bacillithiol system protein YtxJ